MKIVKTIWLLTNRYLVKMSRIWAQAQESADW